MVELNGQGPCWLDHYYYFVGLRETHVDNARIWSGNNIGQFLQSRIRFQRIKRTIAENSRERNTKPRNRISTTTLDLLTLIQEEGKMWSLGETNKIQNVAAAFICYNTAAGAFENGTESNRVVRAARTMFGKREEIKLGQDEMDALNVLFGTACLMVNMDNLSTTFRKPSLQPTPTNPQS